MLRSAAQSSPRLLSGFRKLWVGWRAAKSVTGKYGEVTRSRPRTSYRINELLSEAGIIMEDASVIDLLRDSLMAIYEKRIKQLEDSATSITSLVTAARPALAAGFLGIVAVSFGTAGGGLIPSHYPNACGNEGTPAAAARTELA